MKTIKTFAIALSLIFCLSANAYCVDDAVIEIDLARHKKNALYAKTIYIKGCLGLMPAKSRFGELVDCKYLKKNGWNATSRTELLYLVFLNGDFVFENFSSFDCVIVGGVLSRRPLYDFSNSFGTIYVERVYACKQ